MDNIVKRAMAKWPNVPHCYGWLALDARGNWRMRNEQAQQQNLPGERIMQAALIGFIQRNYTHDAEGRWYFQNGPQRVYVDLEAAPYIVRTTPAGLMLHTDEPMPDPQSAWLTENGRLFLQDEKRIALLDDRDLAECLDVLYKNDAPVTEDDLDAWLTTAMASSATDSVAKPPLTLRLGDSNVPLCFIAEQDVPARFGFVSKPRHEK